MHLKGLNLPDMELVDSNADYSGTQTIFIDFDGAEGVSYDNETLNIHIGGLSIADSGLSHAEQFQILTNLNTTFADSGVTFTTTAPANEEYSTIYVGGDDSAFSEHGSFQGLAETIDAGNLIKNDEAFVFSDKIDSTTAITEAIAHETGHLIGFKHVHKSFFYTIEDFATVTTRTSDITRITPENISAGKHFAASDDTIVVGVSNDDDNGKYSGSAYVYRWNGTTYNEIKLTASDSSAGDFFGGSIAASDDTIVIGASSDDDNGESSGSVYVYRWNGTTYNEIKLTASDGTANDSFGHSVAIDGNNIVVGAYNDDENGIESGSAYVYRWNGTSYDEYKLAGGNNFYNFGQAVAIDGDNIVVESLCPNDTGVIANTAYYVYHWNGESYDERCTLSGASDVGSYSPFGNSVAISGDNIIVSAYNDDENGINSGSAYVYRWNGTDYDKIVLTASDGAAYDLFGSSVAMIDNDNIMVGAHYDDDNGYNSGSVYAYRWNGTSYEEITKLTATDDSDSYFGNRIATDGNNIVVEASYQKFNDSSQYLSLYVFDWEKITSRPNNKVQNDFDGNAQSDILFHNQESGSVGYWSGTSQDYQGLGAVSPSGWEIIGNGDFNGNGTSDILWQSKATGLVGMWESGTSWQEFNSVERSEWKVMEVGDFNGNGTDDILWQHTSDLGIVGIWESGSTWQQLGTASRSSWEIVGVGDINGNGTDDVIWQSTETGLVGMWESGTSWQEFNSVERSKWEITGIGDFNGNGTDDILWQHTSELGIVGMWESGSTWQQLGTTSRSSWEISGIGDFNGNDTDDILWRQNANNSLVGIWEGGTSWQTIGSVSQDWVICLG